MTVLKFDVDVKMSEELLERFVMTRLYILEALGYTPISHKIAETVKGVHAWFEVLETLTEDQMCDLQFLLGDDQPRCRFNYLRKEAGAFKQFNALFSKKLKHKGGDT